MTQTLYTIAWMALVAASCLIHGSQGFSVVGQVGGDPCHAAINKNPLSPRVSSVRLFMAEEDKLMPAEESVVSAVAEEPVKPPVKCPDCDLCDGSGRILGGLGAVLPWIPIKAYRPCPNFVDRGGRYERSGQGLDEIAFGRDSSFKQGQ